MPHRPDFSHVRAWVFDLDNTLYPPAARLFDQIEVRMTKFVMDSLDVDHKEADRLRSQYWRDYGTTLAGLMDNHNIDPGPYLHHVHDIDFSSLLPDPELASAITALPGRAIVYTNGTADYARNVLAARGLNNVFAEIYGVENANFRPKPERNAFETVFAKDQLNPEIGAMFEDDPRNLAAPHDMGMRTVLVGPETHEGDHIHHHTQNLTDFLNRLA